MRVPQSVDYALRALILLASQPAGKFLPAGDLAARLVLPRRFVEQQVTLLARAGIVTSRRGPSGGCALARPASEVSVCDVVLAIQGYVLDVPNQRDSATAEVWRGAALALEESLDAVTIDTVAARQRELDAMREPMYYI